MAKTNAQRQAEYRKRHLHDIDGTGVRLNLVISVQAKRALERVAFYLGQTQRQILEHYILEAENDALREVTRNRVISTEDYYEKRLRRNGSV